MDRKLLVYRKENQEDQTPIRIDLSQDRNEIDINMVDGDGNILNDGYVGTFLVDGGKLILELCGGVDRDLVHVDDDGCIKIVK